MLTGRLGVRFGWCGRLVVQVEYRTRIWDGSSEGTPVLEWRDAKLKDLAHLNRMDLRANPLNTDV
jgi:hypothetical protein